MFTGETFDAVALMNTAISEHLVLSTRADPTCVHKENICPETSDHPRQLTKY